MRHRTATALLALSIACLAPRATAMPQLSFGSPDALPPVMTSKEYDALVTALALDPSQRQAADAIFDDAQQRMFAIAAADAALRQPDAGFAAQKDDRRTAAEREQRRRSEASLLMQETNAMFDALGAVARPDQREALDRERFAAQRRVVRTAIDRLGKPPLARTDLDAAVDAAKLPPEERAAAQRALAAYRQQLAPAFAKLLDESLALPAKVAAAKDAAPMAEGDAFVLDDGTITITGIQPYPVDPNNAAAVQKVRQGTTQRAIVGGTGAYAGARGVLTTSEEKDGARTQHFEFTVESGISSSTDNRAGALPN
jgi:hypothetical protein